MILITDKPINAATIFDRLRKEYSGSIVIHDAVVKNSEAGKQTGGILFQLDGNAEEEMRGLEKYLREKWPVEDVLLIRRIGKLSPGEVISVAAASAEHREAAFNLCQEAVERFKKMKCLKKSELFQE